MVARFVELRRRLAGRGWVRYRGLASLECEGPGELIGVGALDPLDAILCVARR